MKKASALVVFIFFFCIQHQLFGQYPVVQVFEEEASDEHVFYSFTEQNSMLLDKCGNILNVWHHTGRRAGLSSRLLDNGLLIRTENIPSGCCGQASKGGILQLIDWHSNIIWEHSVTDSIRTQHHDFEYLPNGNILYLGWEQLWNAELEELGKDPIPFAGIWVEFVREIKPLCNNEAELIWEWRMKDHLIQDEFPDLENFAVISDEPGKIDINYVGPFEFTDRDPWHVNSIDYHPVRDEIMLNCRNTGEIWIIDHSTTSAEAATNEGGNSNLGGELLFRYGNKFAQGIGAEIPPLFFGSHGTEWIPEGLPNENYIITFNNGNDRPDMEFSTVEIVQPELDENGNYVKNDDGSSSVLEHQIVYGEGEDEFFFSQFRSNAQRLENGYLINEGDRGTLFEINDDGEIVWKVEQCDINIDGLPENCNAIGGVRRVFRAYSYPANFAGFDGQNLDPIRLSSNELDFANCTELTEITNPGAFPFSLKVHSPNAFTCCDDEIIPSLRVFNKSLGVPLQSIAYQIQYDGQTPTEHAWTGNLGFLEEEMIELDAIASSDFNEIEVCVLSINEGAVSLEENEFCHSASNLCNPIVSGIDEIITEFGFYPNPSQGELKVNIGDSSVSSSEIVISNLSGKVLLRKNVVEANTILSLPLSWANGIYLLSIQGVKVARTQKFCLIR